MTPLTPMQHRVVGMLANGTPAKVIAHELHISKRTVEAHLTEAKRRLGAKSGTHLGAIAASRGIVEVAR